MQISNQQFIMKYQEFSTNLYIHYNTASFLNWVWERQKWSVEQFGKKIVIDFLLANSCSHKDFRLKFNIVGNLRISTKLAIRECSLYNFGTSVSLPLLPLYLSLFQSPSFSHPPTPPSISLSHTLLISLSPFPPFSSFHLTLFNLWGGYEREW